MGALLAVAIVACGSSGSGGPNGASEAGSGAGADSGEDAGTVGSGAGESGAGESGAPCDASGITDGGRRCTLAMPVQGGLSETLNGEGGCGDGTGTATGAGADLSWSSSAPIGRVTANFQGGLPALAGIYPLTSLDIKVNSLDGGSQSWTAPSGACTITVSMEDVECQTVFGKLTRIVYGTGTCSQPAAPDTGTTAAPITIGDFQFEHWL